MPLTDAYDVDSRLVIREVRFVLIGTASDIRCVPHPHERVVLDGVGNCSPRFLELVDATSVCAIRLIPVD